MVVYSIDPSSIKASSWNDGFVRAVNLLADAYSVDWFNCFPGADGRNFRAVASAADFVLVKSNWGWVVDRFVRRHLRWSRTKRGIMVSGIGSVRPRAARFYDVIYYQTEWYRKQLPESARLIHAYGINTKSMYPPTAPRPPIKWDWLYVGNVTPEKRPLLLLAKTGRRLVIGELNRSDPRLIEELVRGGVEVREYVPYDELREIYWSARRVYIPATVRGGGERQAMEALACGTPVVVEPDNPKLLEVIARAPDWDEYYYSAQLRKGLRIALDSG